MIHWVTKSIIDSTFAKLLWFLFTNSAVCEGPAFLCAIERQMLSHSYNSLRWHASVLIITRMNVWYKVQCILFDHWLLV